MAKTYNILYFGPSSLASTSFHRINALKRIGCQVLVIDPWELIGRRARFKKWFDYQTGYRYLQERLLRKICDVWSTLNYEAELVWIDGGQLFGPEILKWISKNIANKLILVNQDDPTGSRDCQRFKTLRRSLYYYDLCVFFRPETSLESLALGAKRSLCVSFAYDEYFHTTQNADFSFNTDPVACFVGTLIPGENRDKFLLTLKQNSVPLRIYGNRWSRSPCWGSLRSSYCGPGLSGIDYARILGGSQLNLGLLSHQNRDLATTRSFEVPACGGLLCAERTSTHQLLYEENVEAVFWDDVQECIDCCVNLLASPDLCKKISVAGKERVQSIGVGNEDLCRRILAEI